MNNKYPLVLVLLIVIVIANLALTLYNNQKGPAVAYVKSDELVYGYLGMKEAQQKFNLIKGGWEANLDTLRQEYELSFSEFNLEYSKLSETDKNEKQRILMSQKQNILKYSEEIDKKITLRERELLDGVLNQINSFVEDYGKANNYEVILGANSSGNVLYGETGLDITDELLTAINSSYEGK